MGHSLGKIRDKYIFVCEGGDQLCGRMVSGADFTSESFATLPPHFREEAKEILTEDFLETIMPGYKGKAPGFKRCIPYFLASIIYHEDFLRDFLPEDHPLFRSRVFTQNSHLEELRKHVVTGVGRCPHTSMTATGVPPHLVIAKQIEQLIKRIESLEAKLDEKIDVLTKDLPNDVAARVSDKIRASFDINGVVPLHRGDLLDIFEQMTVTLREEIAGMETRLMNKQNGDQSNLEAPPRRGGWGWRDFRQPGEEKERIVPVDFKLPRKATVFGMFGLWWNGDISTGIRPYRFINRKVDINLKISGENMMFTRYKTVMNALEELANDHHLLDEGAVLGFNEINEPVVVVDTVENIGSLTVQQQDCLFVKVYEMFLHKYYEGGQVAVQRKNDLACATAHNRMVKFKKLHG
jgi:hypothetical protein